MNGFRRKKVQSLTLGEKLKKIRGNKRASFSDISKNTMIQIEYLEYLEKGEYDKLPADVYVKGFLKSFAEYLGADAEDLIRLFEKEKSIQKNILKENNNKGKKKNKINLSKFYITPKIIYSLLIAIFFLGLFGYLYIKINVFVSVPELIILNPQQDAVVSSSQVFVKGKTDKGNLVFINDQAVTVDDNGVFKEDIILKKGVNVIIVKSVNRFGKENKKRISIEVRY